MRYKIASYELQDGRWGPAITKPPSIDSQSVTFSEPTEFDIYFPTKEEADKYAVDFLKEKGVSDKDIEIGVNIEGNNNGDYNL